MTTTQTLAPLPGLDRASVARRDRWATREVLHRVAARVAELSPDGWSACSWRRTASCGRAMGDVDLSMVRGVDGSPSVFPSAGVSTCGSVWACPVCAAKIRRSRTADIEHAARWHAKRGGELVMVTLTLRHVEGDSLARLVNGLSAAYRAFQRSALWSVIRDDLEGQTRTLEVTTSFTTGAPGNGWHPHLHLLLFVKSGRGDLVRWRLCEAGPAVWADRVVKQLGEAARPLLSVGFDARVIPGNAAAYVTKIALEVTRADLKSGTRQPAGLIAPMGDGFAWAYRRWDEYCRAMKGKRAVQWSHGLRALVGLDLELTDEELAAQLVDGASVVAHVGCRDWNRRMRNGSVIDLLEGLERGLVLLEGADLDRLFDA